MKEPIKEWIDRNRTGEYEALKKAVKQLNDMEADSDYEIEHGNAETILCDFLREIGASELVRAFDNACIRVGFQYA